MKLSIKTWSSLTIWLFIALLTSSCQDVMEEIESEQFMKTNINQQMSNDKTTHDARSVWDFDNTHGNTTDRVWDFDNTHGNTTGSFWDFDNTHGQFSNTHEGN